jgi:DNA-binding Xre family transcriptional regulator
MSSNRPAVATAEGRARSEPELCERIAQTLRANGIGVDEQVVCTAGIADFVTIRRDALIEVKLELTRKSVQFACGQLLLYKQAINSDARTILVGYQTAETAALISHAARLGVEIVCWEDETNGRGLKAELLSQPFAGHFTLQWNIQTLALAHGITTAARLGQTLGVSRASLYKIWRGNQVNVSVATLERLAKRLGPAPDEWLRPGDWFRWERGRLIWNVKDVAEQVGFDRAQLAFAAGQYPQQMALFWDGTARFVFVDSLARLAAALETEDRAFDIGEIFVKKAAG